MIYNVLQYLENSAERFPDKIALEDEFGSVTYKEYVSAAKAIGTYIYIYIFRRCYGCAGRGAY